jgi:hypothetical protein
MGKNVSDIFERGFFMAFASPGNPVRYSRLLYGDELDHSNFFFNQLRAQAI